MNQEPLGAAALPSPMPKPGDRVVVLDGPYSNLRATVILLLPKNRIRLRVRISPWTEHWTIVPRSAIKPFDGPEPPKDPQRLISAINRIYTDVQDDLLEIPPMTDPFAQFLQALQTETAESITSREIAVILTKRSRLRGICKALCRTTKTPTAHQLAVVLSKVYAQQEAKEKQEGQLVLTREKNPSDKTYRWGTRYHGIEKSLPDALTLTIPPEVVLKLKLAYAGLEVDPKIPLQDFVLELIADMSARLIVDIVHELEQEQANVANIIARIRRAVKIPDGPEPV